MTTLVIAEKPSVGRTIAEALGADERHDGYLEGGGYVVSWCRGHLISLSTPDEYERWAGRRWEYEALPMIPGGDGWKWSVSKEDGAAAQYRILKRLLSRRDVGEVIVATDADREGEGIARRVMEHSGVQKPTRRLWSSSLVPDQIVRDVENARPWEEYRGLGDAAEGRAKADWLVGLNGTRALVTTYRTKLSAGRVQTPTLALLVERLRAIESFKARPFFTVRTDLGGFIAESDRFEDMPAAKEVLGRIEAAGEAVVVEADYKDVRESAPRLYDLTNLQKDASERLGMTAEETLAVLQGLYEKKLVTYPRTDSQYITEAEAEEAEALVGLVARPGVVGKTVAAAFDAARSDVTRLVNDGKVTGHSALMPTRLLTHEAMVALSKEERRIALLVCSRFLEATMAPATKAKAKVMLDCGGVGLTSAATSVKDASWIAVDEAVRASLRCEEEGERESSGEVPYGLDPGDVLDVKGTNIHTGKTSPPKHYTDATLLSAMANAGRLIDDEQLAAAINEDTSHPGGLGTPATRASIIERVIKAGYARRKGKSIVATPAGCSLIDVVDQTLKTPELTAKWELELSRVERGESDLQTFLEGIEEYTREVVAATGRNRDVTKVAADRDEEVAVCPRCGKSIVHRGAVYRCNSINVSKGPDGKYVSSGGCGFQVWETVAGKKLTESQVVKLIEGRTVRASGFKTKKGKKFEALMELDFKTCKVSLSWD